jgi:hypothetical protein
MEMPPGPWNASEHTCSALHPSQHVQCGLPMGHRGEHTRVVEFRWPNEIFLEDAPR